MIMRIFILALVALFISAPAFAADKLDCQVVAEAVNPTEAGGTNDYVNLTDGTISATATAEDEFTVPTEVIVHSLSVEVDVAPTADDTWVFTVVDDSVATPVTCSITGASDTSCISGSFVSATVLGGSDLMVLIDSSTGTADPAAAAEARISFCISK